MSRNNFVYTHVSTVAGDETTPSSGPAKYGGFFVNGSAGSSTLTVYDGTVVIAKTSAGSNASILVNLDTPIACTTSLLGTCSGTGFYSIFFAT